MADSNFNARKYTTLPVDRLDPERRAASTSNNDAQEPEASGESPLPVLGGPVLTLGILVATGWWLDTSSNHLEPILLALVAVVYSASSGSLASGFISAAIVIAYYTYSSFSSGESFEFTDGNLQRLLILTVTAPALVGLIAALKGRFEEIIDVHLERINASEAALTKLRAVLEAAPDAIVIADGAGRVVLINSQTETLFGYQRAELLGKNIEFLMPERFRKAHVGHRTLYASNPQRRLMGAGRPLYGRRKNGSEFPIEVALSPLQTDEGLWIASAIRDVTSLQLQEKLLTESQQQYEGLINSIDGIVWEADPRTLHFSFVSKQAERILGYPTNQWLLEPKFWREHIHPEDRALCTVHCRKAAEEKKSLEFEYRMVAADGRTVWLKNSVTVVVENNRACKLQGVMVDISESKTLTQEINARAAELEKANRVKDEFIGHMSFDLRTPLTDVVGYTGMLRDQLLGPVNVEQEKALGKIINRSNDLLTTINSILNVTRLGVEDVKVQNQDIKLDDFLNDLKSGYRAQSSEAVTLIWDYSEQLPILRTDRSLLKQILQNLIQNALKFTKRGSVKISVICISNAKIVFQVGDTGIGIAKHSLSVIFDPSPTGESARSKTPGSQALGLHIVKKLTDLLGGKIEAESQSGKGSTFTLTIPLRPN